MSFVSPESVAVVADSLGVALGEAAARVLAPDVEYRLREVVQVRRGWVVS